MAKAFFYQVIQTRLESTDNMTVTDTKIHRVNTRSLIRSDFLKNKRLRISEAPSWQMLDLIKLIDNDNKETNSIKDAVILFGSIGKKATTSTSKRNISTYEKLKIEVEKDEHIETGTYFCLFLDDNLMVYLSVMGAPAISSAIHMFSIQVGLNTKIIPVIADDVLETLKKKDVVTKIYLQTTLPSDNVLSDVLGLPLKDFDNLRNNQTAKLEITISAGRKKEGLFDGKVAASFYRNFRGIGKKAIVSAREEEETKSIEYNLIENRFTRETPFKVSANDNPDRILDEIIKIYNENRADVIRYIRND